TQWTLWFHLAKGPRPLPVTLINPQAANPKTVIHEMLHNWGLDHTVYLTRDPTAQVGSTNGSPWDPMGHEPDGIPTDVNAYHKQRAGWLQPPRVLELSPGANLTVRIERLDQPTTSNDCLMVNIPISGAVAEYYTVEARRRTGYDSHIPEEGVVIHRVDESTFNSVGSPPHFEKAAQCVPPPTKSCWSPGQTFSDAQAGIKIAVLEEDATGYKVQISVDPA